MEVIVQFMQAIFNPLVVIFTISNLASMGLQVNMRQMFKTTSKSEVPGAGPRMGLGGRAGSRVSDHPGPSPGGALRNGGASHKSGAVRTVPPAACWQRPVET